MARVTQDWVGQMSALVAAPTSEWPADEVAAATRTAARLITLARELVSRDLAPSDCGTGDGCRLSNGSTTPCVCGLAHALAGSASAQTLPPVVSGIDEDDLVLRMFADTLARAGAAVYVCRRVLHTTGECLFGDDPGGHHLCGLVLVAAHRLGGPRTS